MPQMRSKFRCPVWNKIRGVANVLWDSIISTMSRSPSPSASKTEMPEHPWPAPKLTVCGSEMPPGLPQKITTSPEERFRTIRSSKPSASTSWPTIVLA